MCRAYDCMNFAPIQEMICNFDNCKMMEFQIFVLCLTFLGTFTNANENKTRCYETYCYTMLNEGVSHSSISDCPSPYQYLEIYNREMMNNVIRFAGEIHAKINYVELRLECQSTICYWKDSMTRAEYTNWGRGYTEVQEPNTVLAVLLTLRYDWFYVHHQVVKFSTICMKKMDEDPKEKQSDFNPTSDPKIYVISAISREEVAESSNTLRNATRTKDCKMELLIFVVVSGVFHLMALLTIAVLIASRRRGQSNSVKKIPSKKKISETEKQLKQNKVESKDEIPKTDYPSLEKEHEDFCDYANLTEMKRK